MMRARSFFDVVACLAVAMLLQLPTLADWQSIIDESS